MAKKEWHINFIKYMKSIVNHPNYKGLKIGRKADGSYSWVVTTNSEEGEERKQWALKKASELKIPNEAGVFAKVMLKIHPTKFKTCQICGKEMSLLYIYPNANLVKSIIKEFGYDEFDTCTSIYEVVDALIDEHNESSVNDFLIKKFHLKGELSSLRWRELLDRCELECRNGHSKLMGPGAMSNFPDRFDGFHSYNRCCRSKEDKGRSKENLKSYTKDRRAYEYWSDGNIHAANQYMGSDVFRGTSADHIGAISLGFLHDSLFLRPMTPGENYAKRDRLRYEDIEEIINIEAANHICGMSWHSKTIWDYIKANYQRHPECLKEFQKALKTSMNNFMNFLWRIIRYGKKDGEDFCIESFLRPNLHYFDYDYEFDQDGRIIRQTPRKITESTKNEPERYFRVSIESVFDYHEKKNRNLKFIITEEEKTELNSIINGLKERDFASLKNRFVNLVKGHENAVLNDLIAKLRG